MSEVSHVSGVISKDYVKAVSDAVFKHLNMFFFASTDWISAWKFDKTTSVKAVAAISAS